MSTGADDGNHADGDEDGSRWGIPGETNGHAGINHNTRVYDSRRSNRISLEVNFVSRPVGSAPRSNPLVMVDGPGESQTFILTIDNDVEEGGDKVEPQENLRFLLVDETEIDSSCSICLIQYLPGEEVTELDCSHVYHDACITAWMKKNPTCPLCRHPISA